MSLTREQILAKKPATRTHQSEVFGGEVKYHRCTVGEKGRARKMATGPDGLDNETLECALVVLCLEEPKLSEIDIEEMKKLEAGEIAKLAALILGKSAQDPK